MKIVFNPGLKSDMEDISVSYLETEITLKRGEPMEVSDELGESLLKQPEKFQAV